MGQSAPFTTPAPQRDLHRLTETLLDVSERLTDDEILALADSLHDQLRRRREVRRHSAERLERLREDRAAH